MSKNPKKELTTKQKQIRYRVGQYGCYAGMGLSVMTPSLIMGAINFEEWFATNNDGYKIGIGATIGLVVTAIAMVLVTQKAEKRIKVTDMWITLICCWFAVFFALKMLGDIILQVADIGLWTGLGLCSAFGFYLFSTVNERNANSYKNARAKVKEETIEEKAKREVENEERKKQEDRPVE